MMIQIFRLSVLWYSTEQDTEGRLSYYHMCKR